MEPDKIDWDNLGFNYIETKKMFVSDYKDGKWDEGNIVDFGPIKMNPAACVLNYGQGIFEGMKALRAKNGEIVLFRPEENAKRFNRSAERLLMPSFDEHKFIEAVKNVVIANKEYIPPYESGGALYLRPLMFADGPILGVKPADKYKVIIFAVPVGPYFPEGFKGINLKITKKYTRAAPGGTGDCKTICNYAGTMKPAKIVKEEGYAQVIYLDAVHKEYIEEVGTANFFAVIDGKLVTPATKGTILEGINRKSVMKLAEEQLGIIVEERDVSYKEIFESNCTEVFCAGTAAVITPIASVAFEDKKITYNEGKPGEITNKIFKLLTGIQRLEIEDYYNWVVKV
ncbi:MAG: branched-chain amino acid aminotransferase [Candidatus Lokiarchaeota archaeon]